VSVFTFTPDFGAQAAYKPRVRVTKFGDGYEQRVGDGINIRPASWPLKFAMRDDTERTGILAFLEARNGVEAFDWTPPFGGSAIRAVCRNWEWTPEKANLSTITATFEQVFEP